MLGTLLGFPLLGFLINGVFGKRFSAYTSGILASSAVFASFLLSVAGFLELQTLDNSQRFFEQTLFTWFTVDTFSVPFVLRLDPLSSMMTLVVTGVGFLIHVYSIGYMSHDATPGKFFAYLNLFTFAMLALVLGGNLPILFLGWEGVGLCSYLLIGYWYEDLAKASAGKKAFIVNRIGDLGFLIGIFLLFGLFNTVDFAGLRQAAATSAPDLSLDCVGFASCKSSWLTLATICLFIGAMGKSAQFPLYVWLPDAMAGPTPVSALIHAATMVTAGIYMIVRLNFLFALCPITMQLISGVGMFTAFFAATIALTQKDIKKILAYSTVSQLGYMFVACGVGAFSAGIFHLVTHAFFKALLFLGAGSVIHGMHEEQDIFKMGGLQKYMPKTFLVFAVATVAIAGIPPLSGFFSKDEILWSAYSSHMGLGSSWLWFFGALTALLTAFYMTRLTCLTFLGEPRYKSSEHDPHASPHESPNIMLAPLFVLAFLSILGGFLGIPHYSWIEHWLSPVISSHQVHLEASNMEYALMFVSVLIAALGMGGAYYFYVKNPNLPKKVIKNTKFVYQVLLNKYYVDEFFEASLVRPIKRLSDFSWKILDTILIDGIVINFARFTRYAGEIGRLLHTGALQLYAVFILIGLLATVGYFIYGFSQ